jgi:hypothetical protein
LYVVIISWDGMHDRAAAIAKAIEGHAERLDVIYSNHAATPEEGAGQWHRIAHEAYFGHKFRLSLDLHDGADEPMLQINADAETDDWPALVAAARAAFDRDPSIGVWGPEIDWTPWPTDLVATGASDAAGLLDVLQSDGVVWALAPAVLSRLSQLDYQANNLGWGIDWAAMSLAHAAGLRVVRDPSVLVRHPESRGYDSAAAEAGMETFLAQLAPEHQDRIAAIRQQLAAAAQARPAAPAILQPRTDPAMYDTDRADQPAAAIAEVHMIDGSVYLAATGGLEGRDILVQANGIELGFEPCDDPVAAGLLPRSVPIAALDHPACDLQLNGHGIWQVEGWNTLRVAFEAATPAVVRLMEPMVLPPGTGAQRLVARLAAHRGRGVLVARLTGMDGRGGQTFETAFAPRFEGGAEAAGWQQVGMVLPRIEEPALLHLELDYRGNPGGQAPLPHVFFIAAPQLVGLGGDRSPSTPALQQLALLEAPPVWHRASLAATQLQGGSPLTLVQDGTPLTLCAADDVVVTLLHDWGHVIEFDSSDERMAMVWVDVLRGDPEQGPYHHPPAGTPSDRRAPSDRAARPFGHAGVLAGLGADPAPADHARSPPARKPQPLSVGSDGANDASLPRPARPLRRRIATRGHRPAGHRHRGAGGRASRAEAETAEVPRCRGAGRFGDHPGAQQGQGHLCRAVRAAAGLEQGQLRGDRRRRCLDR